MGPPNKNASMAGHCALICATTTGENSKSKQRNQMGHSKEQTAKQMILALSYQLSCGSTATVAQR